MFFALLLNACTIMPMETEDSGWIPFGGVGGVWGHVEAQMPFDAGYRSLCTQGAFGPYSHMGGSTLYDVDFDTPNDRDDLVFAPVNGTAYVHDRNPGSGFGIHVNIDLGDGTYVMLGHLASVFIGDGTSVSAGSLIGFEGTTGNSSGDHMHIGRHQGLAILDAVYGDSIGDFSIVSGDAWGDTRARETTEFVCGLTNGRTYTSQLATPRWHPDGTLVKTPYSPDVFLLEAGNTRLYSDEQSFWARNRDFADLVLVSPAEMACYGGGVTFSTSYSIDAVYHGGKVYLLEVENGVKSRREVPAAYWPSVLESWGIYASSTSDLPTEGALGVSVNSYPLRATATFREGTLVREASISTVYVVSNGIAMPVADWDTFILLGFANRRIQWVDDGAVAAVQGYVGNCAADAHCIRRDDVLTCGGPADTPFPPASDYDDEEEDPPGVGGEEDDPEEDIEEDPVDEPEEDEQDDPPPASGTLRIAWAMPGNRLASRITLSGEYIDNATGSSGWFTATEVYNARDVVYEIPGAEAGESFRFSVEYVENGHTTWSCLAPFPPGTMQGAPTATFNGTVFVPYPVADPSSAGCGLIAHVP